MPESPCSEPPRRESPLNQVKLTQVKLTGVPGVAEAGVLLAELPFQGLINLRGNPEDEAFCTSAAKAIGCALPLEPNTLAEVGDRRVFWLGPDEWMVLTPPDLQDELIDALQAALAGRFCSVVDVTSYYTTIAVAGPHAGDLLAKGCTLDLHPRAFGAGQCAQTQVAKATTLIWPVKDGLSYRLLIRRSFADYFGRWLDEAVREFGGAAYYDLAETPVAVAKQATA